MEDKPTRREQRRVARREAILSAAREVVVAGGALDAPVDTVARQANVSKGTVYLYFSSKEVLLAELLREGLELLAAQLTAAYAEDDDLPPDVRVARLAGAYLEFAQTQPAYARLRVAFDNDPFNLSLPTELFEAIVELGTRGVELIGRAVREGIKQGVFRRIDADKVAGGLWAALNGALLVAGNKSYAGTIEARADTLFQVTLEMFLRGMQDTHS